jgi:phosphoribosylglycinamide formyltransferase 2
MYQKKIMLLGSGELGKELVISLQRLGQYVIAVDNYPGAPAMQVAHDFEVIDMLDGSALDEVVHKHRPDLIVPEVEAIRTERFYAYEQKGIGVVPSAKAANYTMNRKLIRDLAVAELGLKTAAYRYARTLEEFRGAVREIGIPCVVKPLMSSSGKGQSVVKSEADVEKAWNYAMEAKRGDIAELIVEEFISFHTEITLLTVTQKNGEVLFCPSIGHRQEGGDYRESWQPCVMREDQYAEACRMAEKVTRALTGSGIWGVEFFISDDAVYFSELSPRPHDTGMVTLAGTQTFSEFELHARAILGLPIPGVTLLRSGASAVILHEDADSFVPDFSGIAGALGNSGTDVRIFGKPVTRKNRRMGVVLSWETENESMHELRQRALEAAQKINIERKKTD